MIQQLKILGDVEPNAQTKVLALIVLPKEIFPEPFHPKGAG